MKIKFLAVFILIIFSLLSCEYFEEGTTLNVNTFEANIEGLPTIPDSLTFVGWFERFDQDKNVEYVVRVFVQDANSNGVIKYKSEKSLKKAISILNECIKLERIIVKDHKDEIDKIEKYKKRIELKISER